jgi:ribosomal protein S18 acetylase RimI-like enzyme
MEIIKIDKTNIEILKVFLDNNLPSTFRYFSKRSVDCIENHIITIIGMVDSIPVGYGHIDKDDTDTYWLGVCILDNFHSNGYGSSIIKYLIEHVDIPTIHLTVDKSNQKAVSLYKKFGFSIVTEFDTYYKMCLKNNAN